MLTKEMTKLCSRRWYSGVLVVAFFLVLSLNIYQLCKMSAPGTQSPGIRKLMSRSQLSYDITQSSVSKISSHPVTPWVNQDHESVEVDVDLKNAIDLSSVTKENSDAWKPLAMSLPKTIKVTSTNVKHFSRRSLQNLVDSKNASLSSPGHEATTKANRNISIKSTIPPQTSKSLTEENVTILAVSDQQTDIVNVTETINISLYSGAVVTIKDEVTTLPSNFSYYSDYDDYRYYEDYDYYYDYFPLSRELLFTRTLFFCEYIFSAINGSYDDLSDSFIPFENMSLTVISDKKFVNVCLPFYRLFHQCEEKPNITMCKDDNVTLLHNHSCQRPSDEDIFFDLLLASTLLHEDQNCFQAVCNGSLRVVHRSVGGNTVRLISPNFGSMNDSSCHMYVADYLWRGLNGSKNVYRMKNDFWPFCFSRYTVLWTNDVTLATWSFLPTYCQTAEIVMLLVGSCVVISAFIGNFFVLVVMFSRGEDGKESSAFRTSLALADFLLTLFVLIPCLCIHIAMMASHTGDGIDPHDQQHSAKEMHEMKITDIFENEIVNEEFWPFLSLAMNLSCLTSILNMFSLSFREFRKLKNFNQPGRNVVPSTRVKFSIIFSWFACFVLSLMLMYNFQVSTYHDDANDRFSWHWFNKMPVGVSHFGQTHFLLPVIIFFSMVCILTVLFFVLSLIAYLKMEIRTKAKNEFLSQMEVVRNVHRPLYVIFVLILKLILFLTCTSLACTAVVLRFYKTDSEHAEVLSYICWWGFLAKASWTPWVYNLPSLRFRMESLAFLKETFVPGRSLREETFLQRITPRSLQRSSAGDAEISSEEGTPRRAQRQNMRRIPSTEQLA